MFKKLRNKLIWINLGITTIVIVVAFTAIYLIATGSASKRPVTDTPMTGFYSIDLESMIQRLIEGEKQAAARDLLITLIISGLAIEVIVAIISYYLAEEAIKPVREAYEAQKIFIANASHEIKTPLSAISANLEAADIHGNKWISNIEKEVTKLTTLNNDLLSLARSDLKTDVVAKETDLAKNLNEAIDEFKPRLKKLKLSKKILIDKKIKINREDFLQIFSILMDNAIKYAKSQIKVTASETKLEIANDGAMINEKDLPHIFERFYQVDKSADGVGLGLAIAKSLSERNGWELTAESKDGLTTFMLSFGKM